MGSAVNFVDVFPHGGHMDFVLDFVLEKGWAETHAGMDGNSFSVPGQILQEQLHVCWVTTLMEQGRI